MTQNNQTPWWRISDGAARRAARIQQTQPAQQTFAPPIPASTEVSQDPAYQSAISLAPPGPPWADMPVDQPAAQPNSVLPPDQRGPAPSWLSNLAGTAWGISRFAPSNLIAAAVNPAMQDPNYGAKAAEKLWAGQALDEFAPADTWLGKAQRNRAREAMTPLWKAQTGDIGGAISDSLKATAQGSVAGQGLAGIANLGGRVLNPQPGQEPIKFGDVAGAAMGALAMGPIGLAPKELMDVMNVAPQAAETLAGRLSDSIPDTIQVGGVELPNPVKGSAFLIPSNAARFADAPLTYLDQLGQAITTGGPSAVARQFGMTGPKDIKAQAQEFQRTLGADLTAQWRGKNSAASDPAGAVESALFQDPVEYALWRVAPISFSGPQAKLAAVKRILAGEDPQAVIKGEYPPATDNELLVDESARFKELVDRHAEAAGVIAEQGALAAGQSYEVAQEQKLGAAESARYLVNQTRMIRGEELPLAELMGQTVVGFAMARLGLDPVNRIPFHEMFGLKNLIPSPKRPNILNEVYNSAAKAAGTDFTMGEVLAATKRGLSPEQVARADRAQATLDLAKAAKTPVVEGAPPRERAPNLLARAGAQAYLTYINSFVEFLPQTKAKMAAGHALDLIHTLTREADNPLQVYEIIKQWIIDPNSLKEPSGARPGFDTVPTSFKAELARPVIEGLGGGDKAAAIKVIEKLTAKMAKREEVLLAEHNARPLTPEERATGVRVYTPEEQAKRFTSLGFLSDMADSLQKSANEVHGVKPMKDRAPLERWGAEVKSWLGEFYLRTLGYVFRNTMSDSVTMAMDGVFSFEGMKQIEAYMGKMQLTEDYIKAESQSEGSGGGSKFKNIPIIGDIQGWIGKNNQSWEVARRTRVFYNSFRQFMGINWEPVLGVDVMQTLGPDLAPIGNALRDGWRSGQTVAEIRQTTQRLINGRTRGFNVVDIPSPPEFAKNISPEGQVRIRTEMQRVYDATFRQTGDHDAAIKKATDDALANYKGTATADYIRRLAALGKVVNPAPSSIRTFQEDQTEFEQRVTDLARNTLPPGPERDALIEQVKGAYSEREQSVIAARDLVSKRLAGLPASADAANLAKLIVYAHETEHQTRNASRLAQDALVKEAWSAIAEMGKGGDKTSRSADMKAIWDKYRAANDPVQQRMTADVAAAYEWVANAIERVGADPSQFDAIIKERPDWVDKADWTEKVVREAVAAMTRDDVSFETVVALTRSGIDIARANSYALAKKLTAGDPTLTARVFDVLSQAERDIARQEAVTLSEIRLALARKDAGQITFDDYKTISDEKWKEYSDYARSRYNEYAMNSLTWVEIESGQLAKGLRDLGYSNEQIADLLKQAATKDNGAAIASIFEKAMPPGAPKPPTGKQPPPQQGDLPLDGGTPTPKTPPGQPPAPGGAAAAPEAPPAAPAPVAGGPDLAPPNLRTPAAIAAEAKALMAEARDRQAVAKAQPTADNRDLAREATARADAATTSILLERIAARAEATAKSVPTEANKTKATEARRIANESWLSYEQERLNPTPKPITPAPAGAAPAELTPAEAAPVKPGKKSDIQRATEYIATTTVANAEIVAKKFNLSVPQAEQLIAAEAAKAAPVQAEAAPAADRPKPKLNFPPGAPAPEGAPAPAGLDPRIEPLAYDVSGVDPRRLLTAIAPDDRQYGTILMILPGEKVRGSHDAEGNPTPGFPASHQPRGETRSGAEFVSQRQRITNRFRVGEVTEVGSDMTKGVSMLAAPIPDANGDYNLVGGNMRKAAESWLEVNQPAGTTEADSLQKLYDTRRETARRYGISDAEIAAAGDKPMLVRAFVSEITPEHAAYISNKGYIASAAPMERAREYVGMIDRGMLDSLKMGEGDTIEDALRHADNATFVKAFINRVPPNDRTAIVSKGQLTDEGVKMVKYAIFLKAYSSKAGEKIVQRLINASGEEAAIGDALFRSIASTLEVDSLASDGQIPADLSLTDDIGKALAMFDFARSMSQNQPYKKPDGSEQAIPLVDQVRNAILAGPPMIPDPNTPDFSPTTQTVATILALNANAPKVMAAFIDQYNKTAMTARPGLDKPVRAADGSEIAVPTKQEVLNHILSENLRRSQEQAANSPAALKKAEIALGVAMEAKGLKAAEKRAGIAAARAERDRIAGAIEAQKKLDPVFKSQADLLLETKPRDQRAYLPPKEGDAPLAGEKPAQVNERPPTSMAETRPGTTAQQVADGQAFLAEGEINYATDVTLAKSFENVAPAVDTVLRSEEGRRLIAAASPDLFGLNSPAATRAVDKIRKSVTSELVRLAPDRASEWRSDMYQQRIKSVVEMAARASPIGPGIRKVATGSELQYVGIRNAYEGMSVNGSHPVVGASVSGGDELAAMGHKLWRNPKVEYAHLVFTAGEKIVGDVVISQRLPGAVDFVIGEGGREGLANHHQWILAQAQAHGADGVWDLHNHPSADPTPSSYDLGFSRKNDDGLGGLYKGSIVINSHDYSIRLNGEDGYTRKTLEAPGKTPWFEVYDAPFPVEKRMGPNIQGSGSYVGDLAQEGTRIANLAWAGGDSVAVLVGSKGTTVSGVSFIRNPRNFMDPARRDAAARSFMRATGSTFVSLVFPPGYARSIADVGPGKQQIPRGPKETALGTKETDVLTGRPYYAYTTWDAVVERTASKHVQNWDNTPVFDRLQAITDAYKQGVFTKERATELIDGIAQDARTQFGGGPAESVEQSRLAARTPEEEAQAIRDAQAKREQERYAGVPDALGAQNAKGLADLRAAGAGKPSSPLALDAAKWAVDSGKTTPSADDIQTQFKITQPEAAQVWQELRARGVIDATGDIIPAAAAPPEPAPADAGGAGGRLPPKPPGPPPPAEPPDPMSIDPDAQTPENIALQESSLHNQGDHEAPRFEDMAKAAHTEQQAALEAFRKAVEDYAAKPLPEGALSPEAQAAIFRAEDETIKKFNSTFDAAKTYARSSTNFTLLDYAQKRGFDTWLSAIAPFSYWATRQGRNFALRLMQNPAYLTAYLRFKQDLEAENRRRGTRSRFKGSVKLPLADISRGKFNDIYVDPIEVFLPFAGLMGQDVTDPQGQMTGIQQVYSMAERLGLRPSPIIDIPLRASGALQADNSPEQAAQWGKGSIGAFTPQGGLIQGATAALGIGGPGGVNIEEPFRKGLGLPDTGAYDPYRYGRSVADISASLNAMQGPGMDPRPFLAAQEWIGNHRDTDLAQQLRQATPAEVAAELNIDPQLAALALAAARAGAKQASQQRAVAQIGSSMLGLRLQELPQGEQIRTGMADAERGAAYSPMTGVGSREEVKAVQDQYPALQVQRGQYQALPGDTRDSAYLFDNAQKKMVNQAFDGLAANVLAARPWDRRATRLVEDARYTALAHTDRKSSAAPGDWQAEYQRALAKITGGDAVTATASNLAYRPLSVAGASPAEATQIRQQEAMRAIVRTQPRAEAFTGPDGQIDFASYNAARDAWEKALPTISKGIPEVFAIVGQADKEGRGAALRAWLDKLGPDQLDEYRRRSDTPLEAAQRTYFEAVYQPAMDAYRKASDLAMPDAWNQTVGQVGTLRGSDLIPQIQQVYGNRFTPDELASLKTLVFPPAVDVMRANMSESAKAKDGARSAFWDYMNTAVPPGSPSYNLHQIPLIAAALDQSSRATVTAEQYTQALQMARGWVAQNYGEPTPKMLEEWNTARAAKKELDNLILVQLGPEGAIALRAYQSATAAADKEAVRRSNPLVQKVLNLQQLFASKNPTFARYYKSAAKGAGIAKLKSIRR